jgi:hypothetical protein
VKNKFFFSSMLVLLAFGLTLTSCGPSAAKVAITSASSVGEVKGLKDKLTWLKSNAKSGGNYILEIDADEEICGSKAAASNLLKGELLNIVPGVSGLDCDLSFKDSNITITLRGVGANRTISTGKVGSIFNVGSGVTLVLDDNITLQGRSTVQVFEVEYTKALVEVESGGTLIMNYGSTITGNLASSINGNVKGGGVHVHNRGTFIMKGGIIARNKVSRTEPDFNASTKDHFVYKKKCGHGGGVYVGYDSGKRLFGEDQLSSSGTVIKTGGTITGYSSDPSNGNAVVDINGNEVINGCGHALFLDGKEPKAIDNTIGPEYSFHYSNGTFKEIQSELKPKEAIAEPDNNNPESSVNSSPEIQETAQQAPQQVPQKPAVTQQEALQEYQVAAQKMQATQREALQEYQATIQKNPAATQEAAIKYQKTLQEAQRELQEAAKKYQETMQNRR